MKAPERMVAQLLKASLGLMVTVLLTSASLSGSAVGAYEPTPTIGPFDQDPPPSEGAAIRMAPQRPPDLEPLAPGTGFIPPPMDLSHLTGQRILDAAAPLALPSEWDWRDMGMLTPVRNQGACGSCYSFGTIANFESKMLMDGAGAFNFSENHAKECNWRELNNFQYPLPGDYWGSCHGGSAFMLASLFSQAGTVLESCDPYVASDVGCTSSCAYVKTLLDWRIISGNSMPDTDVLKQYIYDHGPVITSMYADSSRGFDGSYDGSYTFDYTTPGSSTNHLVLIVGWSDNLPPVPGGTGTADGWIVKNSWGAGWGAGGYFFITYGAANTGLWSSYVEDWQDYDTDGDIWYYDDDGWWEDWGCSSPTVWGLAKFVPDEDTYATRVEFWTTDATTDIDVYLYDDFNGSTYSNLLTSKLNNSFTEAGYHSVALDEPLPVTNGDDIIAVMKLTNVDYGFPAAADPHGTIETGRTYLSCSGSGWTDMGATYDTDVAVRLRTSAGSDGTVTLTKTVINDDGGTLSEVDFQPYLDGSPVSWDTTLTVSPGTHAASETSVPGYEPSAWGGDCGADGTFAVAPGGVYNCTITNDDMAPTVTLTKTVVNDDGGSLTKGDFQPYLDGEPVSWDALLTVSPGSLVVSEAQVSGYSASDWGGDCTSGGLLTAEVGGTYTCTITNDDIAASVTLVKTVTNDNGGTLSEDDFEPYLDGTPVSWDTSLPLSAGSHTISEAAVSGYEASSWSGDCESDGALTAALGGDYTCAVTNDDVAPSLMLVKSVVNSYGGTLAQENFPAYIGSSPAEWGVRYELDAGSYLVSEDKQFGYAASAWSGDCASTGAVNLQIGDEKICYVTNYDIAPMVTITKTVVNDDGGTLVDDDFVPYINGTRVLWGDPVTVVSGTHTISETEVFGYEASSWGSDCAEDGSLAVAVGGVYTCTITNDDVSPTVTLTKTVINDSGGSLTADDFVPYVDGNPASWDTPLTVSAGTHVVSETEVTSYAALPWGGDCDADGTLITTPGGVYTCTVTNDDIAPTVTLTKTVINDDGGTLTEHDFRPYIDGLSVSWRTPVPVLPGTHTVSETQGLGYASSGWAGTCAPDGTLTVELGGTYTCTIDNNDIAPTVTLTKTVVNDDGGTLTRSDFPVYVDGTIVAWDTPVPLSPGSHTVSETLASGYEASAWGGDCTPGGSLAVEAGGVYTCTITNNDIGPTLTLAKTLINDDGGTLSQDDFSPYVDGTALPWDITIPVEPGPHAITETLVSGYEASSWGGDCASDGTLAAAIGGAYTCSVTNDDVAPTLMLIKSVVNDDGGTLTENDFAAYIGSSSAQWGVQYELDAGAYLVKEDGQGGYEASAWSGDCASNGTVSLNIGDEKTCYITNYDIAPTVTLTKTVLNDGGGTLSEDDFRPYIDGSSAEWGVPVALVSGTHTVSETQVTGYQASSWGGDCNEDGSLAAVVGGVYTCTITNDDVSPTVTLTKTVINDNGGTLVVGDFVPYIGGNPVSWDMPVPLAPGMHTVSETQLSSYASTPWGGDCADDGSLTVDVGGTYTCTVTNNDIPASVVLTKTVVNNDGGNFTRDDFQPYLDGDPVSWGTMLPLSQGSHTVTETEVLGYAPSGWEGDCAVDGTLTVSLAGTYTCTIANDDITPTVTLTKTLINDDGGTLDKGHFRPHVDGNPVSWDSPVPLTPGSHAVSETLVSGYDASAWGGDCAEDGSLMVELGGHYTCTVTNDDESATVTLSKTVINDDGGILTDNDFQPHLDGSPVSWDSPVPLTPGSHTVSETLVSGYDASAWGGDCAEDGSLTAELGVAYTCVITNDDIAATVALSKTVINDDGGNLTKNDFQPHIDGSPILWNATIPLEPGPHTISETVTSGYAPSSWGGDCASDGTLTAAIGGVYTCTVTNDDVAPTLMLIKSIVNDDGGTLTEGNFAAYIGSFSAEWGVRYEHDAGAYLVREDGQFGYEASPWSGDCSPSGAVSLEIGDEKTCYITNYDIAPTVTLTKTVVNDDGGTLSQGSFQPYIDGSPASWGVPVAVISGTHSVSETHAAGYTASSWAGNCDADGTLTAQVGGVYTCSVTNDDVYVAPTVTLLKTIINDDGGTLTEDDFGPYVNGNPASWDTPITVLSGTHSVSETQVLGYEASSWGGDCETDGTLRAAPGGVYACTVTNDDIAPTLALTKTVVNTHGGTLSAADFRPYIDGTAVPWGLPVTLPAGSHAVSETQVSGYIASAWDGDCAENGTLVVEVGGAYTCTIANSDVAPTVILSKVVVNDDGGTLSQDDFQPHVNGSPVTWDTPVPVFSGTHTISETVAYGYAPSLWGGDCETDGTLAAELGGTYTCSVVNDDKAGSVMLIKMVVNDDGGTLSEESFYPYVDGLPVPWAAPVPLAAGTHTVSETEVIGYTASDWGRDCAEDGTLVVDIGGVYTCTVTNNDIAPTLRLAKMVVNDNGGALTRDDFYPYLDGYSVSWGASIPLSAGSHTVSETQVSSYTASAWGGDCTADGALDAVPGGVYTCTVTNDDIGPVVASIEPDTGVNTGTIHIIELAGSNFLLGATVKLVKVGQPDIHASAVNVESATKITCSFDLSGASTGRWGVVVENPDSRVGVLAEGFMVFPPDGERFRYLPVVMRR